MIGVFGDTARVVRSRPGTTLVDLVITVLVIGILAAVAAPRFANAVAQLSTEAMARRIASDVNFARRTAMQTSTMTRVTFRASPTGYDMLGVKHPAHPAQAYAVNLTDVDASVTLASYNFDGGAALSFNSYGRPLVGTVALVSGTVQVTRGGYSKTVIVNSATGEASVP